MKILLIITFLTNLFVFAQRDPRPKDQANVYWNGTYSLYSLTSDEEIKPNSYGKYEFWGTTNEDPQPIKYSLTIGNTLYVYKFISYYECSSFCNEIRLSKGLALLQINQVSEEKINDTNSTTNLKSVVIGSQTWTTENLNVSKFRNGDHIPEVKTNEEWINAGKNGSPAWCYYNNDPKNGEKYGKLYNWYAVNDPRGLAPIGWCIPSDSEWILLSDNLGGMEIAGEKMKSNIEWFDNINGSNVSGFTGFPSGYRYYGGNFSDEYQWGCWWTSTESFTDYAWFRSLYYFDLSLYRDYYKGKGNGFSVRCVKEVNYTNEDSKNDDIVPNDISILEINTNTSPANLKSVKIGDQTWTTENLNVETFRNGDIIPEVKTDEEWYQAGEHSNPAWCYYNNDPKNGEKFGRLYNQYAIRDSRGLAPEGWHIPSEKEWSVLENFLGRDAGTKMKSSEGWEQYQTGGSVIPCNYCIDWNPEYKSKVACHYCKDTRDSGKRTPIQYKSGNGNNTSGFFALPSGERYESGSFSGIGTKAVYRSTELFMQKNIGNWYGNLFESVYNGNDGAGYSIRLIKD
jgi:uncharacterized protein (TIGR02145 family)